MLWRRSKVDLDDEAILKEDELELKVEESRAPLRLRQIVRSTPRELAEQAVSISFTGAGAGALCALQGEVRIMVTEQYKMSLVSKLQRCHLITASFVVNLRELSTCAGRL